RVRDDLNSGRMRDAFAHLRLIGLAENLPYCPPERLPDIAEPTAKQLFLLKARNMTALYARHRLDFTPGPAPALSVVMVLHNQFALTMAALASLRENYSGGIELILVDNGSTDETPRIGSYVSGAIIIRNAENEGFLRACNQGLARAAAPALLFLNNDTELGPGCILAALERLFSREDIGAVGGKIIRMHGRLQEAGSIIWADGTTTGYLRDASPLAPEANFLRDVDYCSGVFLLCRADLVKRLGGFDPAFSPAYYEEVDLCIRMAEAGYRIVYDPAAVVHHLEYGSAANTEASMMLMRRGRGMFRRKHERFLGTKFARAPETLCRARSVSQGRRILFLEDTIPLRRLGSGFVRANDVVRAMAEAGHQVSVLPVNGARHDIMSLFGDLPETVEVLHDRNILTLSALLRERADYFDLIWVSRTHNLDRVLPILREAGIDPRTVPVILDTEAIESLRDQAAARLKGGEFDLDAALAREFANAGCCRHVTAVSQAEAGILERIGLPSASVLGTIREPEPTPREFAEREGLLLVAAIHQMDSPNLDALRWYAKEILPALARLMPAVPKLTVIGYAAPGVDLSEFAGHPHIDLRGAVDDTGPAYDNHRVFIAPTRFAAGTPYKLYEAASRGIPCVATGLLAGQLDWTDGAEILSAPVGDAEAFASQIARLYQSEVLWTRLREAALRRLARENGRAAFDQAVREIIAAQFSGSASFSLASASA
ncbi:MAG TPA: glycosyltransferase, partial [Acetobacteraceae bacterium]|nr:glycosyltransferase [Acetobacteraceae bacterium]